MVHWLGFGHTLCYTGVLFEHRLWYTMFRLTIHRVTLIRFDHRLCYSGFIVTTHRGTLDKF